jgi:hypothetical protein
MIDRSPDERRTAQPDSSSNDLCLDCGLCCDGTIFEWVRLGPEEVAAASANGLEPEFKKEGPQFAQPCRQFGGVCRIYAVRPTKCREFRCLLLERVEAGAIDLADARDIVVEARRLASAADGAGLATESRSEARARWAGMTDGAGPRGSAADAFFMLTMTALNRYLDRFFRRADQHRIIERD